MRFTAIIPKTKDNEMKLLEIKWHINELSLYCIIVHQDDSLKTIHDVDRCDGYYIRMDDTPEIRADQNVLFIRGTSVENTTNVVWFKSKEELFDYTSGINCVVDRINQRYQSGLDIQIQHQDNPRYPTPSYKPEVPVCECGAKHTSNPNYHLKWCPLG